MTNEDAIKLRRSIRNYDKRPIEDKHLDKINQLLSSPERGPFGNKPRFVLIEKPNARQEAKVKLGTYGFISHAAYFIGGCVEKFEFSEVDYGYSLERIIIELTKLNLGTCWVGGTFKRKDYALLLKTTNSETIPCITPIGYAAKKKSLRERLGLTLTDGSKRFPFEKVFFEDNCETPMKFDESNKYHKCLELVRRAPSAINKQPWRVFKHDNKYHFYLLRDKKVGNTKNTDLQKVDLGIALAHFKLGIEEYNLSGKWHISDPKLCDSEYIISWIAE